MRSKHAKQRKIQSVWLIREQIESLGVNRSMHDFDNIDCLKDIGILDDEQYYVLIKMMNDNNLLWSKDY